MANFEIPENPEFSTVMRRLETTDPAAADLFNTMFAQLLENDVAIVGGTTKVGNTQKLNGLTAEEFVNNGNMLINTDFSNPVNSSGKTEWSGVTITIDGWKTNNAGDYVELKEYGLAISLVAGSRFYQDLPLKAGTYTISVDLYSDDSTTNDNLTIIANGSDYFLSLNGKSGVVSKTFTLTKDVSSMMFGFMGNVAGTVHVKSIKLELGSVATPIIPPNKEVEKLKCGATVGDAESVNGVTVYKRYAEIDSSFTNQTPILDLVKGMASDSQLTVVVYTGSTENYPTNNGLLEINKSKEGHASLKFTNRNAPYGKTWFGIVQYGMDFWSGWICSADGGNANAVNDVTLIGNMIKIGINQSIVNQDLILDGIFNAMPDNTILQTKIDKDLFPSMGIPSVASKYLDLYIYRCEPVQGDIRLTDNVTGREWCSTRHNSPICSDWKEKYLPLSGGKVKNLTIARENNASEGGELVLEKASDSILNGDIAIDIFTNKLRFYEKDGNNYRGVHIDLSLCENNVKSTLLHTGNSKATVISNTAPTDTSALWYDTTNKVCKYYKDGAWQQ